MIIDIAIIVVYFTISVQQVEFIFKNIAYKNVVGVIIRVYYYIRLKFQVSMNIISLNCNKTSKIVIICFFFLSNFIQFFNLNL